MFYHMLCSSMFIIAAPSMTLVSTSGASEGENRHVHDETVVMIFSSVTLVTHFLIVMVLLDSLGQNMCQGHHPESD